jgi:PQQ-dependent catabolism-associated CXXCW motif protein
MKLWRLGAAAIMGLAIAGAGLADPLPEGVDPVTGYRMENYRAPTPEALPGGTVADYAMVERASHGEAYRLIDVYAKGAVHDPISGEWTNMDDRRQIPGSIWLPGVGSGALDKDQEAYFQRNLQAVTKGDKGRGIMFYCMSDCWQSWNAARRAIRSGYSNVAWYPLGTDGWTEHGGVLVAIKPVNFFGSGS